MNIKTNEKEPFKKYYKEIICLNCNNMGHIQKNCKYPINSYGIILYKLINNDIKILIIQRKFSYSFITFLLGKYYDDDTINLSKLIEIIKLIPNNERYSIKTYDFIFLWNNFFCCK